MEERMIKLYAKNTSVPLKVVPGHFATNHSHINYYIDMTTLKANLPEAREIAKVLAGKFIAQTIETVVCLDGTQVLGTLLADELCKGGMNAQTPICVVTPETNGTSQLIFRDNIQPMIQGRHVLVLMASVTTGITIRKAAECVTYYGGIMAGAASIFSDVKQVEGCEVHAAFHLEDIPDYRSYPAAECPLCKEHKPLDALVNSFGYSKL